MLVLFSLGVICSMKKSAHLRFLIFLTFLVLCVEIGYLIFPIISNSEQSSSGNLEELPTVVLPGTETSGLWGHRLSELSQSMLVTDEQLDSVLKDWQEVNDGVGALIILPEFDVIEPVICNAENNKQWLRTAITGEYAVRGTVFLDYRCDINNNAIKLIHGHNMSNGTIFGGLPSYIEKESMSEIQNAELYLPSGKAVYEPYAVITVDGNDEALYINPLLSWDEMEAFSKDLLHRSVVPGGVIHSLDTLILNTCWYGESGREHNLHCLVVYSRVEAE